MLMPPRCSQDADYFARTVLDNKNEVVAMLDLLFELGYASVSIVTFDGLQAPRYTALTLTLTLTLALALALTLTLTLTLTVCKRQDTLLTALCGALPLATLRSHAGYALVSYTCA